MGEGQLSTVQHCAIGGKAEGVQQAAGRGVGRRCSGRGWAAEVEGAGRLTEERKPKLKGNGGLSNIVGVRGFCF